MLRLKIIFLFAMMIITPMALSENDESLSIIIANSEEMNPKRHYSNSDIVLCIESDRVIIQFNGDFGYGHAEIRNLTNNDYVSSDIYAQNGGTEELYISISNSSSYEFSIHFNDGRYSSIIW